MGANGAHRVPDFPADSARSIRLDLVGQYELIAWAGDNALVETHIQIWNASPEILDCLIEKQRYTIDMLRTGDAFQLTSKVKERKTIKNRDKQDCQEVVGPKLVVPVPPNTLPINTEIGHAIGDFTGCQFGEIPIQPSNE